MSLQGIFQIGYVTRDLDRAIALMDGRLEASAFNCLELELPLLTPSGERKAAIRVATSWVGSHQIELIQPLSGFVDDYIAKLPADQDDPTPCFHHLAVRREDPEVMRRDVNHLGVPIVFETSGAGISSIFVDARPILGHHLEFVCATAEGWQIMGWPDAS